MYLRLLILAVIVCMVPVFSQPLTGINSGSAGTSTPATLDGPFQVSVFGNLAAGTQVINILNDGATGTGTSVFTGTSPLTTNGNICVNVYVFDASDEQEIACCSCLLTPNQAVNITAAQLVSDVFEKTAPSSIAVKLIATAAGTATTCTPTTAAGGSTLPSTGLTAGSLVNGMVATGTHIHIVETGTGEASLTETLFVPATLSTWELLRASVLCGFIVGNLSGGNVCPGCTPGVAGASRQ